MENLNLDCVALQHEGSAEVLKQLNGLTREQQLDFWQQQTEQLKAYQRYLIQLKQQKESEIPSS